MNAIAVALAIFLIVHSAVHFVAPRFVRAMVPAWVPRPELPVALGGAALLVDGLLLLLPATRAAAGWGAAGLILVFMVAHLDSLARALRERPRRLRAQVAATVKVLLNLGYAGVAVAVAVLA
ncbi:hypothetical protein SAMN05216553_101248 [Lentzea fradiae]|uniref:DoxX-like family protein n=1 Tax=Lentzea fradiae TaxID=200378 RepID=A0A1G7KFD1_9PSEU|nr:hypothetical protein [Lentzea fradiae]SDF35855.1 hypothetical protein SAMN05216553_101248 [Lentzea fradiae]